MKKLHRMISMAVLCLLFTNLLAQNGGISNNWYFGVNVGINFNTGVPIGMTGPINTNEGVATISDVNGNLLFSTDGIFVYNANNAQMPNGFGLWGDPSSSQSGVIVPDPANANEYYIFTAAAQAGMGGIGGSLYDGIAYSKVDMTLNGGLGDVTTKNVQLVHPACEKITAVKHCNGTDYWVIAHEWNTNAFYAYLITAAGINLTPIISNVGVVHSNLIGTGMNEESIGYLKASPNGKRLALAIYMSSTVDVEVFDFDNTTGIISNPISLTDNNHQSYGIAFSPDNTKLYASCGLTLAEYDLTAPNIANSVYYFASTNFLFGALQLAHDGKIYVSPVMDTALSVINNPNNMGITNNYVPFAVPLPGNSFGGLPNFPDNLLFPELSLGADTILPCNVPINYPLNAGTGWDSYLWSTGDTSSSIVATQTGWYWVEVATDCGTVLNDSIFIGGGLNITLNPTICAGTTYSLPDGTVVNTAGNYVVTIPNPTGCDTVYNITLTVGTPTVTLNPTICQGDSYTLPNGTLVSAAGTYNVTVSFPSSCDTSYVVNLSTNQPTLVENKLICQGDGYTLPNGNTVTTAGTYNVTIPAQVGCDTLYTLNLTVAPTFNINQTATLCQGQTFTLPDGTSTGAAGTYVHQLLSNLGCDSVVTTQIMVNPTYNQVLSISLCQGDSYTLPNNTVINTTTNYTHTFTSQKGCDSVVNYQIIVHPTYQTSQNIEICSNENYTLPNGTQVNQSGIYTAVLQSAFGCDSTVTINLTLKAVPVVKFSAINVCEGFPINFSNESNIDTTGQVSILAYSWDFGDNSLISALQNPNYTYANAGTYSVMLKAISTEGCADSARKAVLVYPTPPLPQVENDTVCLGKSAALLALLSPPNKVHWFENEQDNQAVFIGNLFQLNTVFENSIFYAQSVSPYQCKSAKVPVSITIPTLQGQIFPLSPQVELPNAELTFSLNANAPIATYTWDFGDGNMSYAANPTHQYTYPGIYLVNASITDEFGCKYMETNQVEVKEVFGIFIPSAFSPNGDNINDELLIGANQLTQLDFQVFDRWGRVVFSSNDPNFRWNGKDSKSGRDVPEGVYTFHAKAIFINQKQITQTGTITVIR